MSLLSWDAKDPDEVLDYQINWSARLAGDTIVSSTWIVPEGLTKNSDSHTNTATTIWLSGGGSSSSVTLTNRIETAGGRTMDQSVQLSFESK